MSKNSDYELVAHSAELANKENLIIMAERTHRFWGQTEPEENVKALGIFLQNNNLVLVKAQSAKDQNGLFAVNGDRRFVQFRYVFIPTISTSGLQGRIFKLIDWMSKQPIPLLTEFNANLEPFSIPVLEEIISTETIDREIDKIRQSWLDSNEQKPLFLSALALIINGKRLLLTNEQKDWRDSILILLPASIRSQISLAVGILDEQECPWATLVVKINKHSSRSLPENMIWLNRTNQTFEGKSDENILNNAYVDYIYDHIKTVPNRLKELIEQLDRINDDISLDSLADPKIIPKIIIRLIEVLPDEKQEDFLKRYISELTIIQWEELIPIIIKGNYQQGLVFAWGELGKQATSSTQAIQLMFRAWSSLSSDKLVLILDELNNNLKLAEILLKDNLLLDKSLELLPSENSQHLSQSIYSVIVEKLIALCKDVVANKTKSNFLEAWEFATNLANHQIFDNQTEKFSLIDTSFHGEIPNNQNLLKLTPVIDLLPYINIETFKSSNLHKKLTEKYYIEVRDLLIDLLEEKNKSLAKLSRIAKLAKISDKEDDFYIKFLKPWSPSSEEANTLLVEVIKNDRSSNENKVFSLNRFHQTYNWFKEKQPTLKSIFDELQQNYTCENWYKLAQVIYETEEEQLKFIDIIVGKIFPVEVIQKWLPLIAEHESVRKNFIDNSSAWKNITTEKFNQLVNSSEQYISTLTRCLRDGLRQNWIQGNLLHFLCESWIKQNRVDDDLKNVITSPDVTITFTTTDWLFLQRLSWKIGIELPPLIIKTPLQPNEKNCLVNYATRLVAEYTEPKEVEKLISDCEKSWGLDASECKEILKKAKKPNVHLIIPYLYINDKVIINPIEQDLILLLLQLQLNPEEKSCVKRFFVDVFTQYILPKQNISLLEVWQRTAVEQEVYKEAFLQASQTYVQKMSINDFRNCLQKLKEYKLFEEFHLMLKAMFNFIGIPDRAIQSIIDDI